MPHWGISTGGVVMAITSVDAKNYIANHIDKRCVKQSCWYCNEADKYESYEKCPYFKLKQIAKGRTLTSEDITDDVIEASGFTN